MTVATYAERMPAQPEASLAPRRPKTLVGLPLARLTALNLVAQVSIVVTGGAVRLTGSGLGCPTFPSCTDDDFFPTAELEINGVIEFANRTLTGVVGIIALITLYAVWRCGRRDLLPAAVGVLLGILAQALLGGVTVLTGLNPWTVALHFLVSMVLVAIATRLFLRSRAPAVARTRLPAQLRWLVVLIGANLALTLVLGTVTTGSGPHSGDIEAGRTGLDVALMSRIHADSVYLLIGLTIALVVLTRHGPAVVHRAAWWLFGAELGQAIIGITQYFTHLPVLLVGAHMLGAALLVVATARLWYVGNAAESDNFAGRAPSRQPLRSGR